MTAAIVERQMLPQIPSASGIEIFGGSLYIIGDNSPYLFRLNKKFEIIAQTLLTTDQTNAKGEIIKHKKPDLEALTIVTDKKKKYLLALGSGSIRITRDVGFLIDLEDDSVKRISLVPFYDRIRNSFEKMNAGAVNIEAAIFRKGWLHLFQRGNISGKNILVSIAWREFMRYEEDIPTTSVSLRQIQLPEWNGIVAGFSGACLVPGSNDILFTASLEDTPNVIDDGPSLGSFVGKIHYSKYPDKNPVTARVTIDGNLYPGKIESIAIEKVISSGEIDALAVTDNDEGPSELLRLRVGL